MLRGCHHTKSFVSVIGKAGLSLCLAGLVRVLSMAPALARAQTQATVSINAGGAHGGAPSLLITGRTASWNGISQNVTSKLTNGRTYTTNVWMRTQSGAPTGKVTLAVTANGTTTYITLAQGAFNASGWTLLSGTATISWSRTLPNAVLYVETTAGTDSFHIDDASFRQKSL
jgi:hypothetical protein